MKSKKISNPIIKKTYPIKSVTLIALLSILLLITFFLIGGFYQINQAFALKMSDHIAIDISQRVELQFKHFLEPSRKFIKSIKYTGENFNFINKNKIDEDILFPYLENTIRNNQEINSIYIGDQQGDLFTSKKMPDKSISFYKLMRGKKKIYESWQHKNKKYNESFPDTQSPLKTGYDPRQESWYKDTLDANRFVWSKPYIFPFDKIIGMTVSDILTDKNEVIGVLSVDYSLVGISNFLNTIKVSKFGKLFIMSDNEELLAISGYYNKKVSKLLHKKIINKNGNEVSVLLPVNEVKKNKEIIDLYKNYIEYKKSSNKESADIGLISKIKQFILEKIKVSPINGNNYLTFFKSNGEQKIGIIKKIDTKLLPIKIGIVIPQEYILRTVKQITIIFIIFIIILIILLLLSINKVSNNLVNQLNQITVNIDNIKEFNLSYSSSDNSVLKEIDDIHKSYDNMRKSLISFGKFVPQEVVKNIIRKDQEAKVGGVKKNISILFTDITDFTYISETYAKDILIRFMAKYFDLMSAATYLHKGIIDKYIGDSVMALWGTDQPNGNEAIIKKNSLNACRCALDMKKELSIFNTELKDNNFPPLYTRIGINTGEAIIGNIGSNDRLNYTAIGDAVNLSSRIESINKYYNTEILINESTYEHVKSDIIARKVDRVAVKGKKISNVIYEPWGTEGELETKHFDVLDYYNLGMKEFEQSNWKKAANYFQKCLSIMPEDPISQFHFKRCKKLILSNVTTWDRIERRTSK